MQAKAASKLLPQNRGRLNKLYRAAIAYSALLCVGYNAGIFFPLPSKFFYFGNISVMMVAHQCHFASVLEKTTHSSLWPAAVGRELADGGKVRNGTKQSMAMGYFVFAALSF